MPVNSGKVLVCKKGSWGDKEHGSLNNHLLPNWESLIHALLTCFVLCCMWWGCPLGMNHSKQIRHTCLMDRLQLYWFNSKNYHNRKSGERNVGFLGFHNPATQAETCCGLGIMKGRVVKDERRARCEPRVSRAAWELERRRRPVISELGACVPTATNWHL